MRAKSYHSHLFWNLTGLFLTALGLITLAWVGHLTWYDVTTWGKDIPLIFFGSRTGEAISLGIGMKIIHYFLIGLAFLVSGSLTLLRRRIKAIEAPRIPLLRGQPLETRARTRVTTLLEARGIKKTYGMGKVSVTALQKVSFDVKQGEFVAVFGPSGSGKSTLLHVLGGLDRPDGGEVLIDGINFSTLDDDALADVRLRKIGFVFQFFNLLPRLTALRNVELPLTLADVSEKDSIKKAEDLLKLVGLGDRMNHRPSEMSGGEQQRVAIARALINDPKIVLADEPTGNLDTSTGGEIVQLMKRLNEEKGQTFVVVTHDPAIAETVDRIFYLKDGLIQKVKERGRL